MKKRYVVTDEYGDPCPSCGRLMQVREHDQIRQKQLRQPYYFSKWFCCTYDDCRTTIIHKEKYKVPNRAQAASARPDDIVQFRWKWKRIRRRHKPHMLLFKPPKPTPPGGGAG